MRSGKLPSFIIVDSWSVLASKSTKFYTREEINSAAVSVKNYVLKNKKIPSTVNIKGSSVVESSYLRLAVTNVLNIAGGFDTTVAYISCGDAPNPSETVSLSRNMNYTEYVKFALYTRGFMDKDAYGRAPNYLDTLLMGHIRYENVFYTYSKVLSYYNKTGYLPLSVTVDPWSSVTSSSDKFFTTEEICKASGLLKKYIEGNHALPSTVNVNGTYVAVPRFLQLCTEVLLDMDGSLTSSYLQRMGYTGAPTPKENLKRQNIYINEYMEMARYVNNFMDNKSYRRAPNYITINSTKNTICYESLVYMFSTILNSYQNSNKTLPVYVTVIPWSTVANNATKFFTYDQIASAANVIKNQIETNHTFPGSASISGISVSMPQFLDLATKSLLDNYAILNSTVVFRSVKSPASATEDISSGLIDYDEYVYLAQYIQSYVNANTTAPSYVKGTSLGKNMGFKSLVYMYSQILNSYRVNKTYPESVTVKPWIVLSSPGMIYNYQIGKTYTSVQAAINDTSTKNGHFIGIGKSSITENIIVTKELVLLPVPGVNVKVQAANTNLPVFTINSSGSGSVLMGFTITGSANTSGVFIDNSSYNTLLANHITGNGNGVYLLNSTYNQITGCTITNNTIDGIIIKSSSSNQIMTNNITSNRNGVFIVNSVDNLVSNNVIHKNLADGICIYESKVQVNFNSIYANKRYGLYTTGSSCVVDAENNWWGRNNPIFVSAGGTIPSGSIDIYVNGGSVTRARYLVMNVAVSTDRSDSTGSTYKNIVEVDLTRNNLKEDTTSSNSNIPVNIPDTLPINFATTVGTINGSVGTRAGKAVATHKGAGAGNATVTVKLDGQTLTVPVTITNTSTKPVHNINTNETFTSIQSAIDSNNTKDGHTITLDEGTYRENVAVYKRLTIKPSSGAKVYVEAKNPFMGVFTVVASKTNLWRLNIGGASDSYGVLIYADHVSLVNNTISGNAYGVSLFNSYYTQITGNTLKGNGYGINHQNSNYTIISNNKVHDNWYGLNLINSGSGDISSNNITGNWYGVSLDDSNSVTLHENQVTDNYLGVSLWNDKSLMVHNNIITGNGAGISYYNSSQTLSKNNITGNLIININKVDFTGVVMQSSVWNCGPASLATVLSMLGLNATQEDLSKLSSTDETGTSMYGLYNATLAKKLYAAGMILGVDQLKPGYIVLLDMGGMYHYSVIKSINSTTVVLADSSLGIISMTLAEFTELFGDSGYVLVVSKSKINDPVDGTVLTNDQMKSIVGTGLFGDFISWGWNTFTGVVEKAASVVTSWGDKFLGNNPIWTATKNFGRTVWRSVKYYGNSGVSYIKQNGVVNTARMVVDTINTKLKSAGQKIYTSVNNFLQNQYSKIKKSVINSTNTLASAPVGFFMSLGITAGASELLSGVLVGSFISRHPVAILAGLTFVGTFAGGYIICETFNWKPAPRNLNEDLKMAQDALISLMPLRWQDGRIVKDYDADENWGGLGDGDPGRIGPVVAAGAALMVIASIAYSLAGNNSSVNNSDENNKDYIEINFTNDNGTTTVIRINSNNFTNSPSMVIGRG
ncbi:MAG: Cell surface glycoprotein precursor [Methanobacterium sp. PtaU1.Bin242]|nr:MAG: Cell surface glycoprotein precursor [Methanobacterium sp. PtaU1.Bin242]